MRADGHAPGRPAPDGQDPGELLRRCAEDVRDVAEGIGAVAARTGAAVLDPRLTGSPHRRRGTALAARWALLRALTGGQGLGRPAAGPPRGPARLPGRAGLPAWVAVTALRLRVAAVLAGHPEFARDPGTRRLTDALAAGGDTAAVRSLRALFRDPGAQRALAGLTPLKAELLTVRRLLAGEAGPGDGPGWALVPGPPDGPPTAAPVPPVHARDRGEAAAEAVDLTEQERQTIAAEGSFLGFLRNIHVLSGDGRILVQNVRGPDGVVRYVVQAPGTPPGRPRDDGPRDFADAWHDLFATDSPHTRSIRLALEEYGIPRGAELALIGHGEGGTALLNLARDPEFCRAHRVTHVITVGSPDAGLPAADPGTWTAAITDQHDIAHASDGRPGGTGTGPDPNRYALDYAGPAGPFPLRHTVRDYIEHLRAVVPQARETVDDALTPYRGPVVRTRAYRLRNRAHPPEGHPFLTLPTASVATTAGPVDVPVRYYDSSAAHLCYLVDAGAAQALLPAGGRTVPGRARSGRTPGRALAVLSLYEHRCSTIGPYTEVALTVPVADLWRPRRYDLAADLLRRADLRRTGRHVLSLAVSSEEARAVAREVWGQPATLGSAVADLMGRHLGFATMETGLVVTGRLGPGVRCPQPDWALYGRRDGSTVRTLVRAHGAPRLHAGARVRLRLDTAAAEPMAGQLRRLGLDRARPLLVLHQPRFTAHRSAGAVLPR
ncbi:acetoacetate decarboxylase family protein [Streptomyces sp. NPDC014940]|uniref:acetoacetate decarboxylase family protein n=1 Tax=Streptomyces sp. NPDC014940 TaxID=3364932 RepID=UPI0036F79FD9